MMAWAIHSIKSEVLKRLDASDEPRLENPPSRTQREERRRDDGRKQSRGDPCSIQPITSG